MNASKRISLDLGSLSKTDKLLAGIGILFFVSYIFGFIFGEISSGGAKGDLYVYHLEAIRMFQDNFVATLYDYPSATTPLYHIMMAYLPGTSNVMVIRLYSMLMGVIIQFIFFQLLRRLFPDQELGLLFWASCLIYLSPYFRSVAIWANTDNFALLFVLLIMVFTVRSIPSTPKEIFIYAFIGCLAFYVRQLYLFLPLYQFLLLLKHRKHLLSTLSSFALMGLPGLGLFIIWGGTNPPSLQHLSSFNFSGLTFVLSIVVFYAIPFTILSWGSDFWNKKDLTNPISWKNVITIVYGIIAFIVFRPIDNGGGFISKFCSYLGPAEVPALVFFAMIGMRFMLELFSKISYPGITYFSIMLVAFMATPFIFQRHLAPILFVSFIYFGKDYLTFTKQKLTLTSLFFIGFLSFAIVYYYLTLADVSYTS